MEEEWISRLNTRVDRAERLYVLGDVEEALRVADSTLNEWISLASDVPPTRKLDEDLHVCQKNCICRACILLIVQALYDKGDAQAADAYLLRYYSSFIKMPHSSFLLWLQLKASAAMFDDVCTHVSSYLKANQYRLSRSQYDGLVEMLIFHGLVPLGKYDHALYMVENNKKLSSARRKAFAQCVLNLKRLNYAHEGVYAASEASGVSAAAWGTPGGAAAANDDGEMPSSSADGDVHERTWEELTRRATGAQAGRENSVAAATPAPPTSLVAAPSSTATESARRGSPSAGPPSPRGFFAYLQSSVGGLYRALHRAALRAINASRWVVGAPPLTFRAAVALDDPQRTRGIPMPLWLQRSLSALIFLVCAFVVYVVLHRISRLLRFLPGSDRMLLEVRKFFELGMLGGPSLPSQPSAPNARSE